MFQRIGNLLRDTESFFERNRAFFKPLSQSETLDVLHDQVIRANVVEGADVGVIQRGNRAGFAFKAIRELPRGDFDGDIAPESRMPSG